MRASRILMRAVEGRLGSYGAWAGQKGVVSLLLASIRLNMLDQEMALRVVTVFLGALIAS